MMQSDTLKCEIKEIEIEIEEAEHRLRCKKSKKANLEEYLRKILSKKYISENNLTRDMISTPSDFGLGVGTTIADFGTALKNQKVKKPFIAFNGIVYPYVEEGNLESTPVMLYDFD